jgi:hypothetical protein
MPETYEAKVEQLSCHKILVGYCLAVLLPLSRLSGCVSLVFEGLADCLGLERVDIVAFEGGELVVQALEVVLLYNVAPRLVPSTLHLEPFSVLQGQNEVKGGSTGNVTHNIMCPCRQHPQHKLYLLLEAKENDGDVGVRVTSQSLEDILSTNTVNPLDSLAMNGLCGRVREAVNSS